MRRATSVALLLLVGAGWIAAQPRPPKPERLDAGIEYRRDAATGELRLLKIGNAEKEAAAPIENERVPGANIRVRVELVEVSLNALAPDGSHVENLRREDFRLLEDGVEQRIVHFDAATEPASVALALDASPSVLRELDQMKQAARALAAHLAPQDEVAVVAFAARTYKLLPFTTDRSLLERAIVAVEVLRSEEGGARGSHIYEAVYLTALELFRGRRGRKAIVLLTDGQDSQLGLGWDARRALPREGAASHRLTFDDVCRALASAGIGVHIVSNQNRPRAMTEEWLGRNRAASLVTGEAEEQGMTHYTLWLAELVRRVGGRLYFLNELGTLAETYRRIAETIRTQYTLGYYPTAGFSRPGWRALHIELRGREAARLLHPAAYYVPAGQRGTTDEH